MKGKRNLISNTNKKLLGIRKSALSVLLATGLVFAGVGSDYGFHYTVYADDGTSADESSAFPETDESDNSVVFGSSADSSSTASTDNDADNSSTESTDNADNSSTASTDNNADSSSTASTDNTDNSGTGSCADTESSDNNSENREQVTPDNSDNQSDNVNDNDGYEPINPEDSYDEEKPTLKLESMSLVKVYDGKPLVDDMGVLVVEEGWQDGDGATYTFTESQTNVGSVPNKFTINFNKEGIEDKYNILVKYGELRVVDRLDDQKYILTITGKSDKVLYDGTEKSFGGFSVSGRSNSEYRVEGSGDPAENIAFVIGDVTFYVSGVNAKATGTNAGDYLVDITGSPVVKDAAGNDVTNEFKFEYFPGTFTIGKRKVTLKSGSARKTYDGEELINHEVTVTGDGFVDGEGVTYKFTGKQKEVGESYNYFTYKVKEGTLAKNYNIKVVPGKLVVKEAENSNGGSGENNSSGESTSNSENNSSEQSGSENSSSSANASTESTNVQTADAGTGASEQPQEGPAVLGAKKGSNKGTSDTGENKSKVLGARRGATEDETHSLPARLVIMIISLSAAIYITRKNKRNYNG